MSRVLPGLGLTAFFGTGFNGWGDTRDVDIRTQSALIQCMVLDRVAAEPGSPTDGDMYLLTGTANVNKIAIRDNGVWVYITPREGHFIYVADEDLFYIWNGTIWGAYPNQPLVFPAGTVTAPGVAIGAANDGIYQISAGNLGFTFGGVQGFRANQYGIAIGLSDPVSGVPLRVEQEAGVNILFKSGAATDIQVHRYTADVSEPISRWTKGRGTVATPADIIQNDYVGQHLYQGWASGAPRSCARTRTRVIAAAPSSTDMESQFTLELCPAASATLTEVLRVTHAGGMSLYGTNTVIDNNRIYHPRSYTTAGLPAVGTIRGPVYDSTTGQFKFDDGATWLDMVSYNKSGNFTKGYTATAFDAGTKSSGTYTPAPSDGNLQHAINGGAHTLAAPSAAGDYTITIQYTNNASAGTITLTGFTKQTGDALTTVNGDDFMLYITKINGFTHLNIVALQ